jgi:hypothetical protein
MYVAAPIPLDEPVACVGCDTRLDEQACVVACEWCCETCAATLLKEEAREARAFALERCRITFPPEKFDSDPKLRFAPTREQYEMGSKEAYTWNAVRASNRHNRTNYDALLSEVEAELGLGRDDPVTRVWYEAIRERIEALLEEAEHDDVEDGMSDLGDDGDASEGEP